MTPAPSPFIQSLLQRNFVSALPTATIGSIIDLLKEHRIGAVVITDGEGRLAGILSERDMSGPCRAGMICWMMSPAAS